MVRLEEINGKNVWEVLKLKVSEEQKAFRSTRTISVSLKPISRESPWEGFPFRDL